MGRKTAWVMVLLLVAPTTRAQDKSPPQPGEQSATDKPSTPAEQLAAILNEYQTAQRNYFTAASKATTDEERQKVFEETYPQPQKYAGRLLELARDNSDDPVAAEALTWVVTNSRSGEEAKQALEILAERHTESEKVGPVCQTLVYSPLVEGEAFLRSVIQKNPHREVQGLATYSLSRYLAQQAESIRSIHDDPSLAKRFEAFYGKEHTDRLTGLNAEEVSREAEKLLEKVTESYDDVKHYRGTLADAAKGDLFEIRHLAIGKVAPDIEGQDIDGETFKLSDYRGKVVVIDFWGHW